VDAYSSVSGRKDFQAGARSGEVRVSPCAILQSVLQGKKSWKPTIPSPRLPQLFEWGEKPAYSSSVSIAENGVKGHEDNSSQIQVCSG
jgi:hypothetical protein